MKYEITISRIDEMDDGEKYPKSTAIFRQEVEDLDVQVVVAVVNNLNIK